MSSISNFQYISLVFVKLLETVLKFHTKKYDKWKTIKKCLAIGHNVRSSYKYEALKPEFVLIFLNCTLNSSLVIILNNSPYNVIPIWFFNFTIRIDHSLWYFHSQNIFKSGYKSCVKNIKIFNVFCQYFFWF